MEPHGWKEFDASAPILSYTYSFGPGSANALAIGGAAGLLIVSPPCSVPQRAFDDLRRHGPVRALIAPNAFHHLGLREWKTRFPDALLFAPTQSIARLERQTKLQGIRPLAEAAALAGPHVELIDMPHYRSGEALVRIRSERGLVWYVTDLIMNMPALPAHPVARIAFGLTGSAPGLRFNNIAPLFMVKDRKALKRWLAGQYESTPPQWLIPAHGDIADLASEREAARALFAGAAGAR